MDTQDDLQFDRGEQMPERMRHQFSRLVGMTAAQAGRVVGRALGSVGAHRRHFMVLSALAEAGPASQAQLADRTGVFRSDLVAVLNELAEDGRIMRAPDPGDKRRNVITITEAGTERLGELDTLLAQANEDMLAPLSAAERRQLFDLLGRVNAHMAAASAKP